MARYSQVKGMSVVAIAEGKKVGQVEDFVIDAQGKRVTWLRLRSGSILGGDTHFAPTEAIAGIGPDLVTIRSESDLRSGHDLGDIALLEAGKKLVGNRVVSEDGRYLGEINDFDFAPEGYGLTEFIVRQGNAFAGQSLTVPASKLLTVGSDVVVVASDITPGAAGTEPQARPTRGWPFNRAPHAGDEGADVVEAPGPVGPPDPAAQPAPGDRVAVYNRPSGDRPVGPGEDYGETPADRTTLGAPDPTPLEPEERLGATDPMRPPVAPEDGEHRTD